MNNYPYLIKAKAKANEAKSLFCWFSAKSDSRAERKILDILEDAEISVGRGASHQLPIRTNWLIVDDLPEEGVLDDTWCDRYELGGEDGLEDAVEGGLVLAEAGVGDGEPGEFLAGKRRTTAAGGKGDQDRLAEIFGGERL